MVCQERTIFGNFYYHSLLEQSATRANGNLGRNHTKAYASPFPLAFESKLHGKRLKTSATFRVAENHCGLKRLLGLSPSFGEPQDASLPS